MLWDWQRTSWPNFSWDVARLRRAEAINNIIALPKSSLTALVAALTFGTDKIHNGLELSKSAGANFARPAFQMPIRTTQDCRCLYRPIRIKSFDPLEKIP